MEEQQRQQKVERFLKLGYDYGAIVRVLEALQHDAQTNDILEELIKTCQPPGPGPGPGPRLVARGCSPSPSSVPGSAPSPPRATAAAAAGQESAGAAAGGFRPVVIDGSNVAMSHGDRKVFSCRGLRLAVDWFWDRGLRDITVFIPLWRKELRDHAHITEQHILHELEQQKILVYTPSRCVNGKRVVCYDDRYIVKLAFDSDGVIVSNDNYRDLQTENPRWKSFIEERLLMFSFANDKFMPPDDPLGRNGPTIDDFLRRKPWTPEYKLQHCPYGKKCTYGIKCKFYHPERLHQSQLSVADELRAQSDRARSFQPSPFLHSQEAQRSLEDPPLRASANRKDGVSAHQQHQTLQQNLQQEIQLEQQPSLEADEAFGSLESSLSRLHLQEAPYSVEQPALSCSSGVASYSCSLSGSFSRYSGPGTKDCTSCTSCSSQQTRRSLQDHQRTRRSLQDHQRTRRSLQDHQQEYLHQQAHQHQQAHLHHQAHQHHQDYLSHHTHQDYQHQQAHLHHQDYQHQQAHLHHQDYQHRQGRLHHQDYLHQQAWLSCPALPSLSGGPCSDSQYLGPLPGGRQSHSPAREPWGRGQVQVLSSEPSGSSRQSLRSQLGALFPRSTVERLLNSFPHVSDMSELVPLIQKNWTSELSS